MLMMKLIRLIKASLVVTIGYQGHLGLILTKNIKDLYRLTGGNNEQAVKKLFMKMLQNYFKSII